MKATCINTCTIPWVKYRKGKPVKCSRLILRGEVIEVDSNDVAKHPHLKHFTVEAPPIQENSADLVVDFDEFDGLEVPEEKPAGKRGRPPKKVVEEEEGFT